MLDQIRFGKNVVGTKQTLKMVKSGNAKIVYLAHDVDEHIFLEVENLCKQENVPLFYVENMEILGKACGIHRKTATAAVIND